MQAPTHPPPLLAAFLAAQYRVYLPDGEHLLAPGRPFGAKIGAAGTPWALLTAFNPGALACEARANDAAQSRLLALLRAAGHTCWPGLNSDPRGGHAERSVFALGIGAEEADRLADRFGQCGLLAGRLGEAACLRVLRAHWRLPVVDTPFVVWVASVSTEAQRP